MENRFIQDRRNLLRLGGLMFCGFACRQEVALLVDEVQPVLEVKLTTAQTAPLQQPGGFVFINELFILRLPDNKFSILSRWCTHAAGRLAFNAVTHQLECPVHGSIFDTNGNIIQGPAQVPLRRYQYELKQDVLLVQLA